MDRCLLTGWLLIVVAAVYSDAETSATTTMMGSISPSTIKNTTTISASSSSAGLSDSSTASVATDTTTTTNTTTEPPSTTSASNTSTAAATSPNLSTTTTTTTTSTESNEITSTASTTLSGSGDDNTTEIETTSFSPTSGTSTSEEPTTSTTTTTITTVSSTTVTSAVSTVPIVTTTSSSTVNPTTTRTTAADGGDGGTTIALAISLSILGVVLIVFCFVLYVYVCKKTLPCFGKNQGRHEIMEMPPRKASNAPKFTAGYMEISREDFETQHRRKVADDGRGYREEFKAVQTESNTMAAARDPVNALKNRYDNVLPWDSSRVVLSVPEEAADSNDYINANFVPGYLAEKKFIACQGPKDTTCKDFWRMIWDQKCATIVMTTNLVEAKKIKCHQYWPGDDSESGESVTYGAFVITSVDVKVRNYYVMRTFKLQWMDHPPRMIRQLHYTHWPDFGVPKNPHELLLFRRRVLAANPPHSGPIVVHCSAGVGRTGTFILIDAAMEQLQAEGKVDLFSFLTKMRKYRMMLVQTDAQYAFAHSAILEYIKYGDTEVPVKKFRAQVQSLREQTDDSEENTLDEQFSALVKVQMNKDNMKHGRSSIKKNRVLQIIPYDANRVTLPLKLGQEKSDYINASYIDGFQDRSAYIATQGPLTETASDFWSMIWICHSHNIVMLTGLVEKGHEMCSQYWPEEMNQEMQFGDITVKYVAKDDDDVVDYLVREFVITNNASPDEAERRVRQFHYTGWPEVGLPSDAHGMIEIANRLTSKDKDGHVTPTIVHCSSGGGRTGVFIALNILMEQADSEGLVDVFQTVKSLRAQRPHIIQTQEQLYFCYIALLQYLETNQLASDSATLTSNINSSIGNQSESVAASNTGVPASSFLRVENTTPQGSMNNKLDVNSVTDPESVTDGKSTSPEENSTSYGDEELDEEVDTPNVDIKSPSAQSGDSVNQALLEDNNTASSSSQSDFEVVNEINGQEPQVTVI